MSLGQNTIIFLTFTDADEARAAIAAGGKASYQLPHYDFMRAIDEMGRLAKTEIGAASLPLLSDAEKTVKLEHPDIGDDERKVAATLKAAIAKKVRTHYMDIAIFSNLTLTANKLHLHHVVSCVHVCICTCI